MPGLDAVLIGAGNRGRFVYGRYALERPERLRITAVAEPEPGRRAEAARAHGLGEGRVFADWRDCLDAGRLAKAAIVATGDTEHVGPALAALERGYHVLLEKPIAPEPADCVRVVEAAERAGRILQIGHVLRYAPFYERVQRIAASGALGELVCLDLKEHVAHWHMTHSYVRGKFRSGAVAAPLLLAKACHDLDLLCWLAGRRTTRVASFGSLAHFRPEAAPAGAPARCTEGCPVQADCPHDAERFYLGPDEDLAAIWPWSDVSPEPGRAARRRALETGPYGRCVYRCDNDVVDHQVVALELEGGATASFTVQGLASEERRTLRLTGTRGELRGVLHEGAIEVSRHGALERERHEVPGSALGHFGGDFGLLDHFTEVASRDAVDEVRASGRVALESHLLGFAAERARREGSVVGLEAWREAVTREARAARGRASG